jgi:hypothetical protein
LGNSTSDILLENSTSDILLGNSTSDILLHQDITLVSQSFGHQPKVTNIFKWFFSKVINQNAIVFQLNLMSLSVLKLLS